MFRREITRILLFSLMVILSNGISLMAQVSEHELPALKASAQENFENEEFAAAEAEFRKLMKNFPKDPMYRYYTGICLTRMGKNLEEAVELLYYASGRGVPADAYYYLGEAYRKLYDFRKAKQNYLLFDKEASRSVTREKGSKLLVRSADRASEITNLYNPVELLSVKYVDFSDPQQYEQIKAKGGGLVKKPEDLSLEGEDDDLNQLVFLPEDINRGHVVYFSGLPKGGKNGYEIMQARRGTSGKWTDINTLEFMNSEGDEILPYYDPVGKDLYFASDGREGLGGFDLYRSHYDEDNKAWSEPVNLGFPVNSVYDDYLIIPGADLGMITLFTARQTVDGTVAAYKLHVIEPKQSLSSASPKEIRGIANLGYEGERENFADVSPPAKKTPPALSETIKIPENNTEQPRITDEEPVPVADDYQKMITSALSHQRVADSLSELYTIAAARIRELENPDDRWGYQKQMIVWEKQAAVEQEEADNYFEKIAGYEADNLPKSIRRDTIINDIVVYEYTMGDSISKKAEKVFANNKQQSGVAFSEGSDEQENSASESADVTTTKEEEKDAKESEHKEDQNRFTILDQSPYSDQNPIPVDEPVPGGPYYKIQLGVYSKTVQHNEFGGVSPVSAEVIPDRNLIRYYAGKFKRFDDADSALHKLRNSGFSDAYIVAWYNGNKMSYEKVKKLEK